VIEYSSSLQQIGKELQRIRKDAGFSLRDLGKQADLSPSFLSLVERGECSLSLTSLFAISEALGVEAGDLLQSSGSRSGRRPPFRIWRGEESESPAMVLGERDYTFLHADLANRELEPMLVRISPTSTKAPLTTHVGEEFVYVVHGRLTFFINDAEEEVTAGESIHFTSSAPHTICNHTTEQVIALWVMTSDFSLPHAHGANPVPLAGGERL